MRQFIIILVVLALSSCAVPQKAADQIRIDTAAADRVVGIWPGLSPDGRGRAYEKLREGMWTLRFSLLGELPGGEDYRAHILSLGDK